MFNNSFTVPGFDEDRHSEADAARPVLTDEERAEMAAYDRRVAQLAAQQAPLDGCEDDAPPSWENEPDDECPEPDWHDISAPCGQEEIRAAIAGAAVGYTDTW